MRVGCFAVAALIALLVNVSVSGITLAYKVKYDGNVIAKIKTTSFFESAKRVVTQKVAGDAVEDVIAEPEYDVTVAFSDNLDDEVLLAQAIIENTPEIVSAAEITVNGKRLACADENDISEALSERLQAYYVEGKSCSSEFADRVETVSGYYLVSDIMDSDKLSSYVNGLSVITVYSEVTETVTPFSTKKQKTSSQPIGYSEVTTAGQNGVTQVVQEVTTVDGIETARTDEQTVVVSEVVDEVVSVGTAYITTAKSTQSNSAGFIFPLPNGSWRLSAYYGDGRGHKGVDLCTNYGISIYAVSGGTVVSAGWDGGYGYSVLIDHGNGLSTRYAHASKLFVSAGQTVHQGDCIAAVGSTGDSSGNHLHFEVLLNSRNVNPAPYIGLK